MQKSIISITILKNNMKIFLLMALERISQNCDITILKEAVAKAIAEHKHAGVPISIWQDGKVVQIPPDQIEVHEEQTEYEILPKTGK
jgi:hypothetical protein